MKKVHSCRLSQDEASDKGQFILVNETNTHIVDDKGFQGSRKGANVGQ
jgi:hypothetical protein